MCPAKKAVPNVEVIALVLHLSEAKVEAGLAGLTAELVALPGRSRLREPYMSLLGIPVGFGEEYVECHYLRVTGVLSG